MNQNAINRDQARTGSAGAKSTLARQFGGQRCCQPTIDHHKLPAAQSTSHARRHLTGATKRSGPFIRLGWSASLREINELRRVGLSGADARAASFNLQCTEQPAVQAFADLVPRIHSSSSLSQSNGEPAGVLKECQHRVPKNWESLPKRGSE